MSVRECRFFEREVVPSAAVGFFVLILSRFSGQGPGKGCVSEIRCMAVHRCGRSPGLCGRRVSALSEYVAGDDSEDCAGEGTVRSCVFLSPDWAGITRPLK